MTTAAGIEGITVASWVTEVLTASVALQALAVDDGAIDPVDALQRSIHEGVAPASTPLPWWITFDVMEPQDVKVVGLTQVMARVEFQVKVTAAAASYLPVLEPYRAVHAALESQANQQTDFGLILACERVSGRQYPETTQGVDYRHLGGLYRATVQ